MGCDIHIVLERRRTSQDKWIGVFSSDNYEVVGKNLRARNRDYGLFWRLAGVRETQKETPFYFPKNLPRDISDLAWDEYMTHPTDHHTPSHLTVEEFCKAYVAENPGDPMVRNEHAATDLFGVYDDGCEYRVVFWFDN